MCAIQGGSRPSNQRHISWGLHAVALPVVQKLQLPGGAVEGATRAMLWKASAERFGNMFRATRLSTGQMDTLQVDDMQVANNS